MDPTPDLAVIERLAHQLETVAEQLLSQLHRSGQQVSTAPWQSPAAERLRELSLDGVEQAGRAHADLIDAANALRQHGRTAVERSAALRATLQQAETLISGRPVLPTPVRPMP